jgi:cell division protein FtsX
MEDRGENILTLPMNQATSILRMICGLAILVLCFSQYQSMSTALDAGGQPQLFGHAVSMSGTQLYLCLGVCALIGLVLFLVGAVRLLRR